MSKTPKHYHVPYYTVDTTHVELNKWWIWHEEKNGFQTHSWFSVYLCFHWQESVWTSYFSQGASLCMHVWLHFMSTADKSGSSTFHVLEQPPSAVSPNFTVVYKTKHVCTHGSRAEPLRLGDHLTHDSLVNLIVGNEPQSPAHCAAHSLEQGWIPPSAVV